MRIIALLVAVVLAGCSPNTNEQAKEELSVEQLTLHEAVAASDIQLVKELLNSSEIDVQDDKGQTPLLIAVHQNDLEMSKLLIDSGANINMQDSIQDSPYLYAGAQGRTEIIQYMLEHSTPDYTVFNRYGGNALIPAAEKGHIDNVELLLASSGEDIDHQNNFGYTALIEAVALTDGSKLYQDIVSVLISNGANKALKDDQGKTALDYAKERGYKEMEQLLIK